MKAIQNDGRFGRGFQNFRRRAQAIQSRHHNIQDDQVGFEPQCHLDGLLAIDGLATNGAAQLTENAREYRAGQFVVIGNKDVRNRRRCLSSPNGTVTLHLDGIHPRYF